MAEQYQTMAEIEAKYPNEWVLIANPKMSRSSWVDGGKVVLHSPDRAEFLRLFGTWDDPDVKLTASWYTGKERMEDVELTEPEPGAA